MHLNYRIKAYDGEMINIIWITNTIIFTSKDTSIINTIKVIFIKNVDTIKLSHLWIGLK